MCIKSLDVFLLDQITQYFLAHMSGRKLVLVADRTPLQFSCKLIVYILLVLTLPGLQAMAAQSVSSSTLGDAILMKSDACIVTFASQP